MVFTSSYLASRLERFDVLSLKFILSSSKISAPIEPMSSNMVVISCRYGRFLSVTSFDERIDAAITGRAAFLAPEQSISPKRLFPPLINNFSN